MKCPRCGKSKVQKSHHKMVDGKSVAVYICKFCYKTFTAEEAK